MGSSSCTCPWTGRTDPSGAIRRSSPRALSSCAMPRSSLSRRGPKCANWPAGSTPAISRTKSSKNSGVSSTLRRSAAPWCWSSPPKPREMRLIAPPSGERIMPAAMRYGLVALALCALALAGCTPSLGDTASTSEGPSPRPPATLSPSQTPEPMAAVVDGDGGTLAAYQGEVARFEAAQQSAGIELASLGDYQTEVLWALIDRKLLAHAASVEGQ